MTELNLTLTVDNPSVIQDVKKAIEMIKGVVKISSTDDTKLKNMSEDEINQKLELAQKLYGAVSIDEEYVNDDDRLKYILEKWKYSWTPT